MKALSLFGDEPETATKLEIAFARFDTTRACTFEELFGGYTTLRVLTYSCSKQIVVRTAELVNEVEIVFGRPDIVSGFAQYMTYQEELCKAVGKLLAGQDVLLDKVTQGKVRFYMGETITRHEKLFLLEGPVGTRVIVGSPNFSTRAFSGTQGELYLCFDDDASAWDYYTGYYEQIRDNATERIPPELFTTETLKTLDFDVDQLPTLRAYQAEHQEPPRIVVVQTGPGPDQEEIVQRVIQPRIAPKFVGLDGVVKAIEHQGIAHLDQRIRTKIIHSVQSRTRTPDHNTEDYLLLTTARTFILSGEEWSLETTPEDVARDVSILARFFEGYSRLHGDVARLQRDYFTFMSWLYISPFMCDFRHATMAQQGMFEDYPIFGVLYGKANCGKSELVKTLLRSMFNRETFTDKEFFTRTRVDALRTQNRRYPLAFDDLGGGDNRYANLKALVREDYIPEDEYPAIVVSMNSNRGAIEPAIKKRALVIYTGASLPIEHNREMRTWVKQLKHPLGTALYRAYLQRMLHELSVTPLPPDVLQLSSTVLCDLFATNIPAPLPAWCRIVTLPEYDEARFDKIKRDLRALWDNDRESWDTRGTKLVYRAADTHAAGRLREEIPDYLLREGSDGLQIVFERAELAEFLTIPMHDLSPWRRLRERFSQWGR